MPPISPMKGLNPINFVNYTFRIYNRLNINNKSRPIACPFYLKKSLLREIVTGFLIFVNIFLTKIIATLASFKFTNFKLYKQLTHWLCESYLIACGHITFLSLTQPSNMANHIVQKQINLTREPLYDLVGSKSLSVPAAHYQVSIPKFRQLCMD